MDILPVFSSCLSWVPALWNRLALSAVLALTPSGPSRHFPDEVLIQILSKVPAKYVLRCRSVCRRWKALTSTPDFLELHRKRSVGTIVVQQCSELEDDRISIVDEWGASKRTTKIQKISVNSVSPASKLCYDNKFLYSCNGLLIFEDDFESTAKLTRFILLNPTTRQKMRLITPQGSIYGVFFNPLVKDQYCVLWGGEILRQDGSMNFRIINLDSESKSKSISQTPNPNSNWKDLVHDGPVSNQPRVKTPPVIVDDVLYWMVGCHYATSRHKTLSPGTKLIHSCATTIIKFNTKTEEFTVMGHPGPKDQWCKDDPEHERMHLIEIDDHGLLCLCECSMLDPTINMWILKRVDEKIASWSRWHTVNIDIDRRRYPFYAWAQYSYRPVSVVRGELLLEWRYRGLFALNLKQGTVKRFERRLEYESRASMYPHHPSLLPFRNSWSEIWIS